MTAMGDGSNASPPSGPTLRERIRTAFVTEVENYKPRLHAALVASRFLPAQVGNHLRAALLRSAGVEVGDGTLVCGPPNINGGPGTASNLRIGRHCFIDVDCTFEVGALITLGDRTTVGHQAMILTTTHELGPREHRAGRVTTGPVTIGDGAWLGPRSIVFPGVTVGEGAVVDAGAVVNKDVAPHTRVGGVPAKAIETLSP
jgi:maltose O-acetyltransferase